MTWMSVEEAAARKEYMDAYERWMMWGSPRERWLHRALDTLALLEGDNEKLRIILSHELTTIEANRKNPMHIQDPTRVLKLMYE